MAQDPEKEGGQETDEALAALLAPYRAFVIYVPLRAEVPFRDYLDLPIDATLFEIAPRASLDPAAEAERAMTVIGDAPAAILMPGRAFDAAGTRHGQGGGWYDRFLTYVPHEWLRVGFCYEKQFSDSPLLRQPWDQPMDAVIIAAPHGTRLVVPGKK